MNERTNTRKSFSTYTFIQILMDKRLHLHTHKQKRQQIITFLSLPLQREHANKLRGNKDTAFRSDTWVKEGGREKTTRRSLAKKKKWSLIWIVPYPGNSAATTKCDAIPRNAIAYGLSLFRSFILLFFYCVFVFGVGYFLVYRSFLVLCARIVFLFKFLIVSVTKWIVFYSQFKSNARAI